MTPRRWSPDAAVAHALHRSHLGRAAPPPAVTQEDPDRALDDVERILNRAVEVPRHALGWPDLELANTESRPLGMQRSSFYLVEMARILD
jgi:hypothetical protein